MNLAHAFKWPVLSGLASKAEQPLMFVILTRLLTPDDFGMLAAATIIHGWLQCHK